MKLTAQVKLLPTREQADALEDTLRASNAAANGISKMAWGHRSFGRSKLHKLVYHPVRASSGLSSQMVIRAISKVADAYKLDRKRKRTFKALGAIAYDDRILRWRSEASEVSIWTVGGRERIPFVCGECGSCDKANRLSQVQFICKSCGYVAPADENAALNIRSRAVVNQPTVACVEASLSAHSYKPTDLAVGS